ncbi:unnamed protein product [Trichobilharzia regenti]|nr:unnamed protein product [Trichobilharzia regenti]
MNRVYGANYKLDVYLRIAEYYLKLHETQEAEAFVNRASLLQPECQDQQLLVRYKRLSFLERALAAALLSVAGQQRARLLATLYKDERCQAFDAFPVLEKM